MCHSVDVIKQYNVSGLLIDIKCITFLILVKDVKLSTKKKFLDTTKD